MVHCMLSAFKNRRAGKSFPMSTIIEQKFLEVELPTIEFSAAHTL